MSIDHQGAGADEPVTAGATARVRATSAMARAVLPVDQPDHALVTAELPTITVRPGRSAPMSRYADPARRRGGPIKRDPAPAALRVIVWFLFFVFLFAAAAAAIVYAQPAWVAFARNDVHTVMVKTPPAPKTSTTLPSTKITVLSASPTAVSYAVPASTYSITVETAGRCWTTLHSPINATHFLFARTLPASSSKTFVLHNTALLTTAATVRAIRIMSGTKNLGSVASPKIGVKYTFTPSGT